MYSPKTVLHLVILVALLCMTAQTVVTQNQPSPQMIAANELFKAQKWAEAAKAYEQIVNDEPGNARAWYQLGMSRFFMQQFAGATEAFQKNIAITNNPNVMYNLACAYARLGEKEKAFEWLGKAVSNKIPISVNVAEDTDLASLRDDARFKEIVASLDKQRRPCMYSAESRQFDFWVGEWDVFNQQGQKTGTSVIQQISGGCGVLENWRDVFGGEGKSINFYDATAQKWYQYWIGEKGGPGRLSGVYRDGAMRYEREPSTAAGQKTLSRLTFFNLDANTVRQFAEQSADDGKTWTTSFDLKYVRKK